MKQSMTTPLELLYSFSYISWYQSKLVMASIIMQYHIERDTQNALYCRRYHIYDFSGNSILSYRCDTEYEFPEIVCCPSKHNHKC